MDTRIDRLPPHSESSELAILGCLMQDPKSCIPECLEYLTPGVEVFYDLKHRTMYSVLSGMFDESKPIDIVTVQEELKKNQQLETVGGISFLESLSDVVPSTANLRYYADIVREKYLLRKMIETCTDAVMRVYDYEGEIDTLIDELESKILRIGESRIQPSSKTIKELVKYALATLEDYHQRQGAIMGLETGFPDYDKMTGGLHNGEMTVIAARPSMGKTSLAMNIAEHTAVDRRIPVGVFSLEMTSEALVFRLLCSRARVNSRNIREGFMADRDFPKILGAADKLIKSNIHIDGTSGLSILQLRARARRMFQRHGAKLFIVDYLQLLHSSTHKSQNREQEISEISRGLKGLAKELNVPVIALSQLNRDLERDKKRKPRLSDLRESGAIEQDADCVGLLYKPREGDDDDEHSEATPINLCIAKQRNGPTGEVHLTFLKPYTRFESAAKIEPKDTEYAKPYND